MVGIRNMWTLQSMHMWKDTHFVASVAFGVASGVGIVLVFYVLQGVWQAISFVGLFGVPIALSILYSLSFKMISNNTSLSDPHQLVSFVTNKTNVLYIRNVIYAHCNQSVVNCFSLVTHVHLVSLNLEIQTSKHQTWPIVSVNFNIAMLYFVLFHSVTCYTNSLLSCIHANTIELHNITYTLVATSVILWSLEFNWT